MNLGRATELVGYWFAFVCDRTKYRKAALITTILRPEGDLQLAYNRNFERKFLAMMMHEGYVSESLDTGDGGALSRYISTWGDDNTRDVGDTATLCQLSYDSSEMEKVASPFDDIGFLASGHDNDMGSVTLRNLIPSEIRATQNNDTN